MGFSNSGCSHNLIHYSSLYYLGMLDSSKERALCVRVNPFPLAKCLWDLFLCKTLKIPVHGNLSASSSL